MFRLPRTLLGPEVAERYCLGDCVTAETSCKNIILGFSSEDESGEWAEDPQTSLSAIVGVRADLGAGDLRPLYLAWLAGYGMWERDEWAFGRDHDDQLEPPSQHKDLIRQKPMISSPGVPDSSFASARITGLQTDPIALPHQETASQNGGSDHVRQKPVASDVGALGNHDLKTASSG